MNTFDVLKKLIVLLTSVLLLGCNSAKEEWHELFNGENLKGWHVYRSGDAHNGWYVENGTLKFDPELRTEVKNSDLLTDEKYTNFELSLEWMISEQGNSGVFWGVIEDEQYENTYETGPEIQILDDNWKEYIEARGDINRAGSLYGLKAPSKVVSKGAGEWNHFLIRIDHNENLGYVVFNDHEVVRFPVHGQDWEAMISNSGFSKWPDFGEAETGHIALQGYGGKVAFRNIKIRKLP